MHFQQTHKNLIPVPCWNQYLSDPYNESRQGYILLNGYNKPRSGPVHEIMKRTRAKFETQMAKTPGSTSIRHRSMFNRYRPEGLLSGNAPRLVPK